MGSYWFLLALLLLALEMATGTFYMLVLSVAMAAGGIAAWLSAGLIWQLVLCAGVSVTGTLILRACRSGSAQDLSPDIGQPVEVLRWLDNGMARVAYRGAEWDAEPESAEIPRSGTFYIKEMRGSSLILTHHKP